MITRNHYIFTKRFVIYLFCTVNFQLVELYFSPHPYLFFNPDRNTMTFVGFSVDRRTGNLIDFSTKAIIEEGILPKQLGIALYQNKVNMNENFDALTRYMYMYVLIVK